MEIQKIDVKNKELSKQDFLYQALDFSLDNVKMITFVGAGGKTTLLYHLAKEFVAMGKKVIITTTTHMKVPKEEYAVLLENKKQVEEMLKKYNICVCGLPVMDDKIAPVSRDFFSWLQTMADIMIVEADGSRRLPIKLPNRKEPVIPKETNIVLVVGGLKCIYKPIYEVCQHPELAIELLDCNFTHCIQPKDMAILLEVGYCKKLIERQLPYRVILNQCDDLQIQEHAKKVFASLHEQNCIVTKS